MAHFAAKNILIFGGTGVIGRYITSAVLEAKPVFQSITLFTSAATASSAKKAPLLSKWKAQGLRITIGDLTVEAEVKAAYKNVDTVVSALGRGALQHQTDLLRWAEESDTVKWFLPSEFGTDAEYSEKSAHEKPHEKKQAIRKYIAEHVKRLKYTYIVTGPYFDMWVNTLPNWNEAGGLDVPGKRAYVIDEGEGKIGFTTMLDVGKFTVATFQNPEAAFGKALKVQSFVVTPNQVVASYEKATGSEFEVSKTSLDKLRNLEQRLWAEGSPQATTVTLRRIWAEGGTLYEKNDNELLRVTDAQLDSLDEAVSKILEGKEKEFRSY